MLIVKTNNQKYKYNGRIDIFIGDVLVNVQASIVNPDGSICPYANDFFDKTGLSIESVPYDNQINSTGQELERESSKE